MFANFKCILRNKALDTINALWERLTDDMGPYKLEKEYYRVLYELEETQNELEYMRGLKGA